MTAIGTSCSRPQRVAERYEQEYLLTTSKPYRALIEFAQERKTGNSFALATIVREEGANSRLHISFTNQLFQIDGQEYEAADLKGNLWVWQGDEKTVIEMPDRFSSEMAADRVQQILDELNLNADEM